MGKRQKLNYNSEELVKNLKRSTGQGVDAFFPSPHSPSPQMPAEDHDPRNTNSMAAPPEHTRTRARTHARVHARTHSSQHFPTEQELRKQILTKKHLSTFTFRFQAEELEALDRVAEKFNQGSEHKVSKNDIVRLALNWLLKDHETKKENSLLAKVLTSL